MLHVHPNARTTPVTRAEIARSEKPSSVLARRCGVSTETVHKGRKRGSRTASTALPARDRRRGREAAYCPGPLLSCRGETGVPLWALLTAAGLMTDSAVKNDELRVYVLATGSDG